MGLAISSAARKHLMTSGYAVHFEKWSKSRPVKEAQSTVKKLSTNGYETLVEDEIWDSKSRLFGVRVWAKKETPAGSLRVSKSV